MAVDSTTRRVVYAGNGKTTAFPFTFKVFNATDVAVATSAATLTYGTDYTVVLNSDQETNPGGTVTVTTAPATGVALAITSAIPYDQPMKLTPYDGFNPETLNDNSDRQCAQIQQLQEGLSRAVTVDATDTMTPTELKNKLLTAADSAFEVAKSYADQAGQSAAEAKASETKTAEYAEAATVIVPYKDEIKTVAGAIDAVNTVNESISAVQTVSANGASVTTVSKNINAVNTVSDNVETIKTAATLVESTDAIKTVSENVEAVKTVSGGITAVTTVSESIDAVGTVAENIEDVAAVGQSIEDVHTAAQLFPHVDDITSINTHLAEVHKVGQDLIGIDSSDIDCGEIGDELDTVTTVTDGYIKKVAEHIDDCIHPVGDNLEVIESVAESLTSVTGISAMMSTDYEKIFNEGAS